MGDFVYRVIGLNRGDRLGVEIRSAEVEVRPCSLKHPTGRVENLTGRQDNPDVDGVAL